VADTYRPIWSKAWPKGDGENSATLFSASQRRKAEDFQKAMLSQSRQPVSLTAERASTSMGELLRRFWMPALLQRESCRSGEGANPPDQRNTGAKTVLAFRATDAIWVGIVEPHCPHRGAVFTTAGNEE